MAFVNHHEIQLYFTFVPTLFLICLFLVPDSPALVTNGAVSSSVDDKPNETHPAAHSSEDPKLPSLSPNIMDHSSPSSPQASNLPSPPESMENEPPQTADTVQGTTPIQTDREMPTEAMEVTEEKESKVEDEDVGKEVEHSEEVTEEKPADGASLEEDKGDRPEEMPEGSDTVDAEPPKDNSSPADASEEKVTTPKEDQLPSEGDPTGEVSLLLLCNLEYLVALSLHKQVHLLVTFSCCCAITDFDFSQQEHLDLDARIAQIIENAKGNTSIVASSLSQPHQSRRARKERLQTKPYNENDEEEAVMDDEELHTLLGV